MSLINFTAKFNLFATGTDSGDVGIDSDLVPLIGTAVFTPVLGDDRPALAKTYDPAPTAFKLRPITGVIDLDGQLKAAKSGTVGVRLPARDPVLGLSTLLYRVEFRVATAIGEPVYVDGGYFAAPIADQVVNLADVLEPTVIPLISAPVISSGSFNQNGQVVLQNADGTLLPPISIPNGYLVFVDNGDATWSVGS